MLVSQTGIHSDRRRIEALNEKHKKQDLKRKESHEALKTKVEELHSKWDHVARKLALWEKVLGVLLTPEGHGSNKPDDQTWTDYFQDKIGQVIDEAPIHFAQSALSFQQVIVGISTFIEDLRKSTVAAEKQKNNVHKRMKKRESRVANSESKAKRKADKISDLHECGQLENHKEELRTELRKQWGAFYVLYTVCNLKMWLQTNSNQY